MQLQPKNNHNNFTLTGTVSEDPQYMIDDGTKLCINVFIQTKDVINQLDENKDFWNCVTMFGDVAHEATRELFVGTKLTVSGFLRRRKNGTYWATDLIVTEFKVIE